MSLAQTRKEIKDAILAKLQNEISNGTLSEIKSLNYGDRIRINDLKMPVLWVLPLPHRPEIISIGGRAKHSFTFEFTILVKNNDPDVGIETAEDLNSKVFDLIANDRKLGNLVSDVICTLIEPSAKLDKVQQLFYATQVFEFIVYL